MYWKVLFKKRMFWLILLVIGIFYIIGNFVETQTYSANKTVGWAFDVTNVFLINAFLLPISHIISLIGYGVLALFRKETNLKLSILHFCLLLFNLFFPHYYEFLGFISVFFNLLAIILIFIQFYLAFKKVKN